MGWSIGFDTKWNRDIGYGVPCECDHPDCKEEIDRGLSHVCGGEPYGGECGCGLYFCGTHLQGHPQKCKKCSGHRGTTYKPKPDIPLWVYFKLTDDSWQQWRNENPDKVKEMTEVISKLSNEEKEAIVLRINND